MEIDFIWTLLYRVKHTRNLKNKAQGELTSVSEFTVSPAMVENSNFLPYHNIHKDGDKFSGSSIAKVRDEVYFVP